MKYLPQLDKQADNKYLNFKNGKAFFVIPITNIIEISNWPPNREEMNELQDSEMKVFQKNREAWVPDPIKQQIQECLSFLCSLLEYFYLWCI